MEQIFKETVLCDSIELIGLKIELTRSQNVNFDIISRHWKIFNATLHKIEGRPSSSVNWIKYGVTYKEYDTYNYLASVPYNVNYRYPLNMIKLSIPDGYYAHFYHKGAMKDIIKTVTYIFKEALPSLSGYKSAIIPRTDKDAQRFRTTDPPESKEHFTLLYLEKYDSKFHWNKVDSIIELSVPVIQLK